VTTQPIDQKPNHWGGLVSSYLWANLALGAGIVGWALFNWHCEDPYRFASFLAIGIVASFLKIRLLRMTGTASVGVLVIIVASRN
jgi:hypothetical protein